MNTRPTVRLRPKTDARRIRRGFPWVYANELVTDRRTRALAPGTIATLEDGERQPVATVAVNPNSKIICRILDAAPDAMIDAGWLRQKLNSALVLRESLFDAPFYRLVHAEGDGLPGLIIDRFGEAAAVQPNAAWVEGRLEEITGILRDMGIIHIVKNASGRARGLEGLDDKSETLAGAVQGPVEVPMNGAIYLADLLGGQKTGLYFDQRENHAFVARLAAGTRVLDVFSHVGGFSLAALAAGATTALAVDGSAPALDLARKGAAIMGAAERFEIRQSDAFEAMAALAEESEAFGVVVCDPPAFAPNKQALSAGLRAYEKVARLAVTLVAPGGTLTLCSCSHAAGLDQFQAACLRGIGRAGGRAQIIRVGFAGPDHPLNPALAESGYLKAITFRVLP